MNRILRAAVARVSRLRLRDPASLWPLRSIDTALGGVALVDYDPRRVPGVAYTRLTQRFRSAVELARLIIGSASFDLRTGTVGASAFLVDMNRAFEDFVVAALREALKVSPRVLVQGAVGHPTYLDEGRRVPLKPDLSLWDGPRCTFVGDAKYKRIEFEGYRNADLYQMTAYAIATGLPGGVLVYAAGEGEPFTHTIVNVGKRVEVVTLDLRGSETAIREQIGALADRVRWWAGRAETAASQAS